MDASQLERIWVKTISRARAEGLLDDRQCLLACRGRYTRLREARGNRLPEWEWDERPRKKREPEAQ